LDKASLFSPDYTTARRRFHEAVRRLDWETASYPAGGKGPDGEDLTIDVAIARGSASSRALVVSSGIHGVEGFFGSAVQLGLLEDWASGRVALPAIRCVLLHGLNPFGFAWRRRVNESNVDLNRNLLLEGETYAGSPAGYARLDALLNPERGPSFLEPVTLKLLLAISRYGMPALKQTVAAGQYDHPRGLFYGGNGPSRLSEILSEHFDDWIGDSRRVMHLDFHTGLGAHATCKLLIDYPLGDAQRAQLGSWFGPGALEEADAPAVAYNARGTFGRWCVARYPERDYLYAAAEFGTCKPVDVVASLRAENQAHHFCRPQDASTEQAKRRLMEMFCPSSVAWRRRVLEHGRQLVAQAVDGLLAEPGDRKPDARR